MRLFLPPENHTREILTVYCVYWLQCFIFWKTVKFFKRFDNPKCTVVARQRNLNMHIPWKSSCYTDIRAWINLKLKIWEFYIHDFKNPFLDIEIIISKFQKVTYAFTILGQNSTLEIERYLSSSKLWIKLFNKQNCIERAILCQSFDLLNLYKYVVQLYHQWK